MLITTTRRCVSVTALILFSALEAHSQQLSFPNVSINPQKINPFNDNSEIQKAARELEKRLRQAGGDLSHDAKEAIKRAEGSGSVETYMAFKKHVIDKNFAIGRRPVFLQKGSIHYRLVNRVLGGNILVDKVPIYFDAYVPAGMAAITFVDRIYVRAERLENDAAQGALLAHEFTHSLQYGRLGEKGFAQRYSGQILEAARNGNLANIGAMHDALDLEKEAIETERRLASFCFTGIEINNLTDHVVHYALKAGRGRFEAHSLEPGKSKSHTIGVNDYCAFDIHFDSSYAQGYQSTAYHLGYEVMIDGEGDTPPLKPYFFARTNDGIELTGIEKPKGTQWRYNGGGFSKTGDFYWEESNMDGGKPNRWFFRELSTNRDYVEMIDFSRDISVRLYADKMSLRLPGKSGFSPARKGSW